MTRTANEIEAKIAGASNRMEQYVDRINERITEKMKRAQDMIYEQRFKEDFLNGVKVHGYVWAHERTVIPQKCFATGKAIYSFTKGYKGVKVRDGLAPSEMIEFIRCPDVIWLSNAEFTVRRLKGQI